MPPRRFYWITAENHPDGYVHELPLFHILRARGFEVVPIIWDRERIPALEAGELIIVRTPWDYLGKYSDFLEWLKRLPQVGVHNSANVLRWNSEKNYLRELERSGISIVPTVWLNAETEDEVAASVRSTFPGRRRIVKPVLSAGSLDTYRLAADEPPPTGKFLKRPIMIQPYLEEIETDGERSLVFFGGKYSHAVIKRPRAGEFRVQESYGGRFSTFEPSPLELRFGDRTMSVIRARFPEELPPLYARIDYVLVDGDPLLMEAELLEPDLFFHHSPGAAERFADVLAGLKT